MGVAIRLAVQQVQRDALCVGTVAFEQQRSLGVGQGPFARRNRLVDGRAYDRMREFQCQTGSQYVSGAQLVGEPRGAGQVQARKRGGMPQRRGATEDRQGTRQLPGTHAELPDPP